MVRQCRKYQCRGKKYREKYKWDLLSENIVSMQGKNKLHELVTAETLQYILKAKTLSSLSSLCHRSMKFSRLKIHRVRAQDSSI